MKKSTLKILRENDFITVKKSPDAVTCVMCGICFVCLIILPNLVKGLLKDPLGIALYVACIVFNVAAYIALLLGKIVLDTREREIHIFNPFLHSYAFGEVAEIGVYHKSDDEGSDINKVTVTLKSGKKLSLRTTSKGQAEELAGLLRSEIYAEEGLHDTGVSDTYYR